ncbi:purine-nucleoside phosphorylase [Tessaracoccus sp. OH4464_COT-324]|nr:purine-nucleoside phosphorylase [Tessaracoccus sp. OH4464_COT-324]
MLPEEFASHVIGSEDRAAGEQLRVLAGGEVQVAVVLGSGLAEALDGSEAWGQPDAHGRLSDLPGVLAPVGDGHVDALRIYRVATPQRTLRVVVALGRTHLFEGHGPGPVTAFARAAYCAGAEVALLTNANGCLRDWSLGDVMAVSDHINFSGTSPFDGTVFLDPATCWDAELTGMLAEVCQRSGTYAFLRGPEYQTTAESRLLAAAGADCVGMSTVLEALMFRALGVRVCGMSVVSDLSFSVAATDPAAVLEVAAKARRTVLEGLDVVLSAASQLRG